ncbi:MAG: iron-containing alcohol dehydrogenase [Eubacterium sp.]|nr:iron-containing alcohol dehydrogenase [Eubacterium sp.]
MADYKFEQKAKVTVTKDLSQTLLETLQGNRWSAPMIVIDQFLLESDIIKKVLELLEQSGIGAVIYDKVVPEPPMELIDKGAQIFAEKKCDCVVAIGGGSVIDAARGINIVRTCGGRIKDYIYDKQASVRCFGLIAVPTTSGTGSELSNALVVTDVENQEKLAVLADEAVSEYVILDPNLPKSMPPGLTIQTGLDVFSHAFEAYTSTLSTPVVDAICEKIMFLVVKYLPKAVRDGNDLEARQRMMVAAALGGWVINNGGTHLAHSIGHIIGAKYHIPHGMACAYALPGVMYHTALVKPEKARETGNILELGLAPDLTPQELGKALSEGFRAFRDDVLGLRSFAERNIDKADLQKLTESVIQERFAQNTPFALTEDVVSGILENYG